jgi:hypothetical protein
MNKKEQKKIIVKDIGEGKEIVMGLYKNQPLDKDKKVIERNCFEIKASKGLRNSFNKGGQWSLIKDLKGFPTHKKGGVDLVINKEGVTISNGVSNFKAKYGLIIPKLN